MPNRLLRSLIAGIAVSLVATACEISNPFTEDLGGVVVTVVDSGPQLFSARTFALPDTIVEVPRTSSSSIDHSADDAIVAKIRQHFLAMGWQDVTGTGETRPDVVVLVAMSTRTETGVAYSGWYGAWGYLPYWGAGVSSAWTWGVPAGGIPYAYQAGTVLITMLDVRTQRADTQEIPLLWAAALDGIVSTPEDTAVRVGEGVDQAFAQSPYLRID